MVLTASSNLFDDPVARSFLEEVERFSASIVRMAGAPTGTLSAEDRERLSSEMTRLKNLIDPLLDRIPEADRVLLEGGAQP